MPYWRDGAINGAATRKDKHMGFHFVDILIIAAVGLILFGPKALQSLARNAGKGVGQAKDMKDKFMAELPMDEINKMRDFIPQVPLNSQQAVQMLLSSDKKKPEEIEGLEDFEEVEKPVKPSVEKK